MNVEPALIAKVDEIIKAVKWYSSRNEFIRDAIRSKIVELERAEIRKDLKQVAKTCLKRGWNGEMPTREEREKCLKEFLKEKGLSWDEL